MTSDVPRHGDEIHVKGREDRPIVSWVEAAALNLDPPIFTVRSTHGSRWSVTWSETYNGWYGVPLPADPEAEYP